MKENKPEMRFKGYEDNWEQRKLGEFAIESCEKGHTGKEASKLTVKLHTKGVCKMNEKTQGSDNTQYYIRHAGQLIYGKQNFFNGAIGIVPKNLDKYESTKDVPAFDIDETVYVDWLYQYIARPEIYKSQEINCTGTGSKRFHVDSFFNMNISTPSIEEQKKISNCLNNLDHLITIHQNKYNKLLEVKKLLLKKMFPQDDSKYPEIRFKGYEGKWEQRKLGDIAKTTIGEFVIKTKQDDSFLYPVYNGGSSNTGYYSEFNNDGEHILISARGANAGYVNIYKGRYWAGNSCYSLSMDNQKQFAIDFIYQEMKKNQHLFTDYQQAANIPSISKTDVEKFLVQYPSFQEQKKIGECFNKLDNIITLHQNKYNELLKIKESLLKNMFTE